MPRGFTFEAELSASPLGIRWWVEILWKVIWKPGGEERGERRGMRKEREREDRESRERGKERRKPGLWAGLGWLGLAWAWARRERA